MSTYNTDGTINVTVVTGASFVGLYAPDGSINVVKDTGSTFVGLEHPCGAWWVTPVTDTSIRTAYSPNGSLYVTNTGMPLRSQGQPITVVSGSLFGPPPVGFYYPWLLF